MLNNDKCPPADELMQALRGRSSATLTAEIEDHLGGCSSCQSAIERLEFESEIVDALKRKPAAGNAPVPPDLEQLMTRLDTLHPEAASLEATSMVPHDDFPVLAPGESPDELGRLAHFRVRELLGAGGMGVVYRADDTKLQRPVALKLLRPRIAQDPDARARFLREARAVASVKHEHVIVVYDVGEATAADGVATPYLAMELLDGHSLQAWMRERSRPALLTVVRMGRQTAEALAALHDRGLVHRDVKPANIWIEPAAPERSRAASHSEAGKVKLLDFGLAAKPSDGPLETRAQGTPAYMAPEQFHADTVDARCDLFALGCILFELCTLEHPFPDRCFSVEHTVPVLASDINPNVPRALADLIGRMLCAAPARRPESARQVARELAAVEESLTATDATAAQPAPRSRRWGIVLAGAVGLTVLAAIFVLKRDAKLPPPAQQQEPPRSTALVPVDPEIDALCAKIRSMPAARQLKVVVDQLVEFNKGYSRTKVAGWVETEGVIRFSERTDHLHDIRPLRCLGDLKTVVLTGSNPTSGLLTDLTPLETLRLHTLKVSNNPRLQSLAPLNKMPLFILEFSNTAVATLDDVTSAPLVELRMARTQVKDLTPLRSIPTLRILDCTGCPIDSLEPLTSTSIQELFLDFQPNRDTAVLKRVASLRKINGVPVQKFWTQNPKKD